MLLRAPNSFRIGTVVRYQNECYTIIEITGSENPSYDLIDYEGGEYVSYSACTACTDSDPCPTFTPTPTFHPCIVPISRKPIRSLLTVLFY